MSTDLPRQYLTYPRSLPRVPTFRRVLHILQGLALFSVYWAMAGFLKVPGLSFRRRCALLGVRLLMKREWRRAYNLIVAPLDSVRYFEFDFAWRTANWLEIQSYLDVSSPRMLPLSIMDRLPNLYADLLNPDAKDLTVTKSWSESLGTSQRCRFHGMRIADLPRDLGPFDLITSISVIEHIPDDSAAVRRMWDLLRPGGRLLLTVPCAARASEEYINVDEYELLDADQRGFVFWQRYYDDEQLSRRIFSITGRPCRMRVYGEKRPDVYQQNAAQKRSDALYPYWREPFMMGLDFEFKSKVSDLPGMGVVGMEFIKPIEMQETNR